MTDPSMMPLAPPPPGITPNFEHPASKKTMQIVVLAVIAPITTLFVYLRIYAKAVIQHNFDISDWNLVIGFISTIGYSYTLFDLAVIPGVGNHSYELRVKDVPQRYYSNLIASGILQAVCLCFIKLSLLFFIAKMFWVRQWARRSIYAVIVIHIILYAVYLILSMYYCVPRSDETAMGILIGVGTSRCLNILTLGAVIAGFNAASDLVILAIAVQIIMTLRTSLGRRLRASSIFVLGLAATGLSISNAYYRIANNSTDGTWDYTTLFILTYYEICLAMICACLPCLPVLGKSALAERIMQSRIFSTLSNRSWSRNRSTHHQNLSAANSYNSSTARLAQKDTQTGVTIMRSFDVENTYELQEQGGFRLQQQHGS